MSLYFITGVGTGIGKTYLTTRWIARKRANDQAVFALKPIISGWQCENLIENDTAQLLNALALPFTKEWIDTVSPWRFSAPLSPDMAASKENYEIDFEALIQFCKNAMVSATQQNQTLYIEGVGGAFVPLNSRYLVSDWIKALDVNVILVTSNYLGALSHTLSHVYALAAQGIEVAEIVVNETKSDEVDLVSTCESLKNFISVPITCQSYVDCKRDHVIQV